MKPKIISILLVLIIAFLTITLSGCWENKITEEDVLEKYENVELGKSGYSDGGAASPPYYIRFYAPQSIFDLTKGSVIIQYYYKHHTNWEEEMASEGYAERQPWSANLLPFYDIIIDSYYFDPVSRGTLKETKAEIYNIRVEEHLWSKKYQENIIWQEAEFTEEVFRYETGVIYFSYVQESTVENGWGSKRAGTYERLFYRKIGNKVILDTWWGVYEDLMQE